MAQAISNKETVEFSVFFGKMINAGYNVADKDADGKWLDFSDIQDILAPIFSAQAGIGGMNLISKELPLMSAIDRDEVKEEFYSSMPDVPGSERPDEPAGDAYDIRDIYAGILAAISLGVRIGRKQAQAETQGEVPTPTAPVGPEA